ncbi:hypothetical protein Tco_0972414 [Tanacetum coccineum]
MSESSIGNYKGKRIVEEKEPNNEWINPTSDDIIILGIYVKKCPSDGPIWYKMGYPLPHKLDENGHPHTATCQCCKKVIKGAYGCILVGIKQKLGFEWLRVGAL